MQTLNLTNKTKLNNLNLKVQAKHKINQIITIGVITSAYFFLPEVSFAADDAFKTILDKTTGWVGGSAGKLVTFISLAMAGIMGVAGFPTKYVVGSLGTGLLLSSAGGIVDMIF